MSKVSCNFCNHINHSEATRCHNCDNSGFGWKSPIYPVKLTKRKGLPLDIEDDDREAKLLAHIEKLEAKELRQESELAKRAEIIAVMRETLEDIESNYNGVVSHLATNALAKAEELLK